MHFKTCSECNSIIPLGATECPHCKEPQSRIEYILIPVGIILVLALFAYSASFLSFEEQPKEAPLKPIVKIRKILNKEKYLVDAYLKNPTACNNDTAHNQIACFYNKHIEIHFVKNRANWVKIEQIKGVRYSPKDLELLDLSPSMPTLQNDYVMTWTKSIRGIYEVSVFADKGWVTAIHVNAKRY